MRWWRMNEIRKSESFTNLKQLNFQMEKNMVKRGNCTFNFFSLSVLLLLLHFLHWIYKIAPQGNLPYTVLLRAHRGTWFYHHHFNFVLFTHSFRHVVSFTPQISLIYFSFWAIQATTSIVKNLEIIRSTIHPHSRETKNEIQFIIQFSYPWVPGQ